MFRQGLRNCAPLRQVVARATLMAQAPSFLAQHPVMASIAKPSVASLSRALQQFRFMATEATAEADIPTDESNEPKPVLFSEMVENGLVHPTLIRTIVNGMGYTTMSEVQARTIRPAVQGKDLVAQAKTGTGKTIGFLLPTLQRMILEDSTLATRGARRRASFGDVRGIVLSPTRELAEQIAVEANKLVHGTGLVVQAAVGGTQKGAMLQKARREGCHLLVATPGRLMDLLRDPRSGLKAPNLAALVLDEADRMLDVGFYDDLKEISNYLPDPKVKERQTLLFSATIPKNVVNIARALVRPDNFEFIQTIREDEEPTHSRVPQSIVVANGWYNVVPSVVEIMEREISAAKNSKMPFKAIIYTPTTSMVDLLYPTLRHATKNHSRDFMRSFIHGKLTQHARTRAAENFRNAKSGFLISSDVTARGMDFPNVSHVIQIGLPPSAEQYVHRLGRTGRAGKEGQGCIVVPRYMLPSCRNMLGAFPINPDKTVETATIEASETSNDAHPILQTVADAYQVADPDTFNTCYLSLMGSIERRSAEDAVLSLNELTRFGFGMEHPPHVSEKLVQKIGLRNIPGLNTTQRNNFGSRDRSRGPNNEDNDDPFSNMLRNSVDPNATRRSSNRGGNWGGNSNFGDSGSRGGYGTRNSDGYDRRDWNQRGRSRGRY